jgi:hypothetical protein
LTKVFNANGDYVWFLTQSMQNISIKRLLIG